MNPEVNNDPHIQFMWEVIGRIDSLKKPGEEVALVEAFNCVRMFLLGPSNSKGEPVNGPEKVNCLL